MSTSLLGLGVVKPCRVFVFRCSFCTFRSCVCSLRTPRLPSDSGILPRGDAATAAANASALARASGALHPAALPRPRGFRRASLFAMSTPLRRFGDVPDAICVGNKLGLGCRTSALGRAFQERNFRSCRLLTDWPLLPVDPMETLGTGGYRDCLAHHSASSERRDRAPQATVRTSRHFLRAIDPSLRT